MQDVNGQEILAEVQNFIEKTGDRYSLTAILQECLLEGEFSLDPDDDWGNDPESDREILEEFAARITETIADLGAIAVIVRAGLGQTDDDE
ncbi:MAG: hypothetical protein AAFU78_22490 [Cyanobacteria bacterium J06633_2]